MRDAYRERFALMKRAFDAVCGLPCLKIYVTHSFENWLVTTLLRQKMETKYRPYREKRKKTVQQTQAIRTDKAQNSDVPIEKV